MLIAFGSTYTAFAIWRWVAGFPSLYILQVFLHTSSLIFLVAIPFQRSTEILISLYTFCMVLKLFCQLHGILIELGYFYYCELHWQLHRAYYHSWNTLYYILTPLSATFAQFHMQRTSNLWVKMPSWVIFKCIFFPFQAKNLSSNSHILNFHMQFKSSHFTLHRQE